MGIPCESAAVRIKVLSVAVASARNAGVAGAVGEKDSIRLVLEDLRGGGRAWDDGDPAAGIDQVAGDVPLHAEVEGDHLRSGGGVGLFRRWLSFDRGVGKRGV